MARRGRLQPLVWLLGLLGVLSCILSWTWFQRAPLRQARKAYSESRWWDGLVACHHYLQRHPRDREALRLAGLCAARAALFDEADRYFTQADALLPDELRTHGQVLLQIHDWDRASIIFETLSQQDPSDVATKMTLAALSVQRGRYNQAVDCARAALQLAAGTPQEAHCEYLLGMAYFARGDTSEAASHYMLALEKQRAGPAQLPVSTQNLRLEVIDLLLSASRIDEARAQFTLLPDSEPMGIEQLYVLGRLKMFDEDLAGAREAWEQILLRDAEHFGALFQLGKLQLDQGHSDQAASLLRRAVRIGQESAEAHFLLFQALTQTGDQDGSEQAMKRFRDLNAAAEQERQETLLIRGSPDHRDTQWFLAKRARKAGDIRSARYFLRRALKIDPEFQLAKDMLVEIERTQ